MLWHVCYEKNWHQKIHIVLLTLTHTCNHTFALWACLLKRLNFSYSIQAPASHNTSGLYIFYHHVWTRAWQGGGWFFCYLWRQWQKQQVHRAKDERTVGRMTTTRRDTALGGSWRLISRQLSHFQKLSQRPKNSGRLGVQVGGYWN